MTFPLIRRALAALFAVSVLAAFGCSSTSTKVVPPPAFTQPEADDIAQMIGSTVAQDVGGWMVEIERAQEKRRTAGDTTEAIMRGAITHNLSFQYTTRLGGAGAVWDTSVVSVEVHDRATGNFAEVALKGAYLHLSDISIFSANEDTMFFNTLATDTSLFTVKSFVRSDTVYYRMDNFFDYDELKIHRDQLNPWPISGTASWLIDANKLSSANPAAVQRNILVEVLITFDGTQTPPMLVYEDLDDPSTTFHYTIDLKTGSVMR